MNQRNFFIVEKRNRIRGLCLDKKYELDVQELVVEEDDLLRVNLLSSALNHRDIWITKGMYPGIESYKIMGSDGCGIIDGQEVIINPGIGWGDKERYQAHAFKVLGMPHHGTFSDNIFIDKRYIYPRPHHLNIYQAAALPLAGLTAFRAIIKKCQLQRSDKVLISGIGGGVALMAFQFAMAMGCDVFVTSGHDWKIAKAMEMGAIGGVNYKSDNWSQSLKARYGGVDVVIDSAAGKGFTSFIDLCNPGGRIAFYGGSKGAISALNPQAIFWKQISIFGTTMGSDQDFREMLDYVNNKEIVPIVDEVIPLSNWKKGFAKLENGSQFGKIVFDNTK